MKNKCLVLFCAAAIALSITACGQAQQNTQTEPTKNDTVSAQQPEAQTAEKATQTPDSEAPAADPEKALDLIYEGFNQEMGLVIPDDDEVENVVGLDLDAIDEYHIRYLNPDFGASDVYIVKPKEDRDDAVRDMLKKRQEARIREFTDYDIYNSTEIAENSVLFSRGDYLILLMMEDNESAREIIETCIPENLDFSK